MHTQFRKLLLASGVAIAIASASGVYAATASQEVTDARQESQIWTSYALSPYLKAHELKVSVHEGTATLTGTVDGEVNKDLATQIALGVEGIRKVDNQIVVDATYTAPKRVSGERSFAEVVEDATITSAVKSKLLWSKNTEGLATDVDTRGGNVTLKGTADSTAAKEAAGRLASNTRGVRSVNNQLVVDASKKPTMTEKLEQSGELAEQKITDSWITTKVKSSYMYSGGIESSDIMVKTDSGVVTLTGKVSSGAERALAIELAQNIRGVSSVQASGLTF